MIHHVARVVSLAEVADGVFSLKFSSEEISKRALPGQFVNILTSNFGLPFLRRPFSIAFVRSSIIEVLFNVVGPGTRSLANKRPGDLLDVLGPLGKPFGFKEPFQTAILVAGGLGIAPFPFLTKYLRRDGKQIMSIVGARSKGQIVTDEMEGIHVATDDGSLGFHGNVVDCLQSISERTSFSHPKIFGCGPTRMLRALSAFAESEEIECELSLEGDMACGLGLCQGCPVERRNGKRKYALVCTEGPSFNSSEIILPEW